MLCKSASRSRPPTSIRSMTQQRHRSLRKGRPIRPSASIPITFASFSPAPASALRRWCSSPSPATGTGARTFTKPGAARGTSRPTMPAWVQDVHSWQQIQINSSEDRLVFPYKDLVKVCGSLPALGSEGDSIDRMADGRPGPRLSAARHRSRAWARRRSSKTPSRPAKRWAWRSSSSTNTHGPT